MFNFYFNKMLVHVQSGQATNLRPHLVLWSGF